MSQPHAEAIFQAFAQHNPQPTTELNHTNPFQLLVAVVLSAQTTDAQVNRVTPGLFAQAPDPQTMARLPQSTLEGCINRIGLYRNKASFLKQLAQQLVDQHAGQVPTERAALEALPGVGRKTANVVLNTLNQAPTIAVDTHVFRVSKRLGLTTGHTPLAVEKMLYTTIPEAYHPQAHHWLVLHGRYVCRAQKPRCHECLVATWCPRTGVPAPIDS